MTDTTDQQAVTVAQEAEIKRLCEALLKIVDGNPTCDSPEAQCQWDAAIATAALSTRLASVSSASAEPRKDTVAFVQEWMMSGDHEPDQWHRDFAAAIDARRPTEQSIFDAINEECGTDAAAWIIARLAAPATPEPVPATNQPGEVRVASALREIMMYVNRGHIEGDCSFCVQALEEGEQALAEYQLAALATQPATSQEGEDEAHLQTIDERDALHEALSDAYRAVCGAEPAWSNLFGYNDALDDIREAAATPTPPTLSEDLREAYRAALEDADALERIAEDADDNGWQDWGAMMRQSAMHTRAALARVKAS